MRYLPVFLIGLLLVSSPLCVVAADADSPEVLARRVADRVLKDFPKPPPFDWGEGVLMAGMMRAGRALHEPRYIEFVRTWADHWEAYGVEKLLGGDEEKKLKAYCGQWGPGYPVMLLYEETRDAKYLRMAKAIADFMLTQATRTKDGGLGHWAGNYQLWVDTLYMHGPLLAHLCAAMTGEAEKEHRSRYLRDIVLQLEVYSGHLQDERSGLYYHMYDEPTGQHSPELWARGNGWVTMTYAEALPLLRKETPEGKALSERFRRMMASLRKWQDPETGLWHTVVNRPETYTETSASAMIAASFLLGHERGLLSAWDKAGDRAIVRKAWRGMAERVDAWGWVFGTSGGTRPGGIEEYGPKVTGTYTWGTGAFLIAASAMVE